MTQHETSRAACVLERGFSADDAVRQSRGARVTTPDMDVRDSR